MEKEQSLLTNLESGTIIKIEYANSIYFLEIAHTGEQLLEAKTLDDLAFGAHLGITIEELNEIMSNGAVILLRDIGGELIGESQVITSPVSQHKNLALNEAYDYGTAIHPKFQNKGIAQILFKAQEVIALNAGKTKTTLTARLENVQSLRGRFKAGFQITEYDPICYGPFAGGGARLLLEKSLVNKNKIFDPGKLISEILGDRFTLVNTDNIESVLKKEQKFIAVPVKGGDLIDFGAHTLVANIFKTNNFKGIGLLKPEELNINTDKSSLLVFGNR